MPNTKEDISIVLSGGSSNTDPNLSLGGDPSITPIANGLLNNLFNDVEPSEAETGHEDHRCFYIFNDGAEDVYNIQVWVESEVDGGSIIELGIEDRDEVQRFTISGTLPTSGFGGFTYENIGFIIPAIFNDLEVAAQYIQDTLNSIVDGDGNQLLEDVEVTTPSSIGAPTVIFDILFGTDDGKKNHDTISFINNSYVPSGLTVTITTVQQGAPINTIASTISNDGTPPGGVGFFVPSTQSPIVVPRLRPSEGFPIWAKRVTAENTPSLSADGVTIRFKMETIKP